jgi:hypothetical protein
LSRLVFSYLVWVNKKAPAIRPGLWVSCES